MSARRARGWVVSVAVVTLGCGAIDERGAREEIDRFSELLLVDPAWVEPVDDPASQLPSLPELLASLLADPEPSAALEAWLEAWADESDDADAWRAEVLCPWLQHDSANGCDAACGACTERQLDGASAPFRLSGLSYRPDLALTEGMVRGQGELRLVYAVTRGPAAPTSAPELAMSVIVELPLSSRLTAQGWAERFHALGAQRDDARAFRRALRQLVDDARQVDDPGQVSVRVQDLAHAKGRMLAWHPSAGLLERIRLQDTIDLTQTSTRQIEAAFADVHADGAGALEVPAAMWAVRVDRDSGWPSLSDAKLSHALRLESCHGCHAEEHSLGGFHIAPGAVGRARVSRFLHDPDDLDNDELSRRADALRTLLALSARP